TVGPGQNRFQGRSRLTRLLLRRLRTRWLAAVQVQLDAHNHQRYQSSAEDQPAEHSKPTARMRRHDTRATRFRPFGSLHIARLLIGTAFRLAFRRPAFGLPCRLIAALFAVFRRQELLQVLVADRSLSSHASGSMQTVFDEAEPAIKIGEHLRGAFPAAVAKPVDRLVKPAVAILICRRLALQPRDHTLQAGVPAFAAWIRLGLGDLVLDRLDLLTCSLNCGSASVLCRCRAGKEQRRGQRQENQYSLTFLGQREKPPHAIPEIEPLVARSAVYVQEVIGRLEVRR